MLSRREILAGLAAAGLRGQGKKASMFGDAESYERFMGRWSRLVAPLLIDFAGIPDSGRVLDIGSGTGSLAFAIAREKAGTRVLGIDPSKDYVGYANSKNPFPDRVSFESGDAQQLKLADGAFDACASLLVFNFIPDPVKALNEARRVTKPGGRISAAVWDYGAGMRMLRVFWDAATTVDRTLQVDERNMRLCRSGELSQLWKQGGLVNVEERPLDIGMRFQSFADYWDPFLLGQGPAGAYVGKLDSDRRARLRAEVKGQLRIKVDDAPFTLPARVWAVRGAVRVAA